MYLLVANLPEGREVNLQVVKRVSGLVVQGHLELLHHRQVEAEVPNSLVVPVPEHPVVFLLLGQHHLHQHLVLVRVFLLDSKRLLLTASELGPQAGDSVAYKMGLGWYRLLLGAQA